MNESHSPRRRIYEPEARAGFRHFIRHSTLADLAHFRHFSQLLYNKNGKKGI